MRHSWEKVVTAARFTGAVVLLCLASPLEYARQSSAADENPRSYSEGEAATRLDGVLLSKDLAADIFVTDVDGNKAPDFVARYVGGAGSIWPAIASTKVKVDPKMTEGLIAAEFRLITLGGISVMQKENLAWIVDKVYLETSEDIRIISAGKLSKCAALEKESDKWRTCLIRTYLDVDAVSRDGPTFEAILSKPLPPNGFAVRSHDQEATGLLPIRPDSSGSHYFVTIVDSTSNQVVARLFIRSGEETMSKLPRGSYRVSYAVGKDWQGSKKLFGSTTKCLAFTDVVEVMKSALQLRTEADSAVSAVPCRE